MLPVAALREGESASLKGDWCICVSTRSAVPPALTPLADPRPRPPPGCERRRRACGRSSRRSDVDAGSAGGKWRACPALLARGPPRLRRPRPRRRRRPGRAQPPKAPRPRSRAASASPQSDSRRPARTYSGHANTSATRGSAPPSQPLAATGASSSPRSASSTALISRRPAVMASTRATISFESTNSASTATLAGRRRLGHVRPCGGVAEANRRRRRRRKRGRGGRRRSCAPGRRAHAAPQQVLAAAQLFPSSDQPSKRLAAGGLRRPAARGGRDRRPRASGTAPVALIRVDGTRRTAGGQRLVQSHMRALKRQRRPRACRRRSSGAMPHFMGAARHYRPPSKEANTSASAGCRRRATLAAAAPRRRRRSDILVTAWLTAHGGVAPPDLQAKFAAVFPPVLRRGRRAPFRRPSRQKYRVTVLHRLLLPGDRRGAGGPQSQTKPLPSSKEKLRALGALTFELHSGESLRDLVEGSSARLGAARRTAVAAPPPLCRRRRRRRHRRRRRRRRAGATAVTSDACRSRLWGAQRLRTSPLRLPSPLPPPCAALAAAGTGRRAAAAGRSALAPHIAIRSRVPRTPHPVGLRLMMPIKPRRVGGASPARTSTRSPRAAAPATARRCTRGAASRLRRTRSAPARSGDRSRRRSAGGGERPRGRIAARRARRLRPRLGSERAPARALRLARAPHPQPLLALGSPRSRGAAPTRSRARATRSRGTSRAVTSRAATTVSTRAPPSHAHTRALARRRPRASTCAHASSARGVRTARQEEEGCRRAGRRARALARAPSPRMTRRRKRSRGRRSAPGWCALALPPSPAMRAREHAAVTRAAVALLPTRYPDAVMKEAAAAAQPGCATAAAAAAAGAMARTRARSSALGDRARGAPPPSRASRARARASTRRPDRPSTRQSVLALGDCVGGGASFSSAAGCRRRTTNASHGAAKDDAEHRPGQTGRTLRVYSSAPAWMCVNLDAHPVDASERHVASGWRPGPTSTNEENCWIVVVRRRRPRK